MGERHLRQHRDDLAGGMRRERGQQRRAGRRAGITSFAARSGRGQGRGGQGRAGLRCRCCAAAGFGPRPGLAAGREVHAAIQAAIPWVSSTPRPCRHPPLPAAAALRSCSYRSVNAPRSSPAVMSWWMEPDWSAFGRRPGGLPPLCSSSRRAVRRRCSARSTERGWTLTPKRSRTATARSAGRRPGSASSRSSSRSTTWPVSLWPPLGPGLAGTRPASPRSRSAALAEYSDWRENPKSAAARLGRHVRQFGSAHHLVLDLHQIRRIEEPARAECRVGDLFRAGVQRPGRRQRLRLRVVSPDHRASLATAWSRRLCRTNRRDPPRHAAGHPEIPAQRR